MLLLRSGGCGDHLSTVDSRHVQETSLRLFEFCDFSDAWSESHGSP